MIDIASDHKPGCQQRANLARSAAMMGNQNARKKPQPATPKEKPVITTSNGSTVTTEPSEHGTIIVLDHPDAPDDMRHYTAGRIVDNGGFQPVPFCVAAIGPEVLRAIADLIEQENQ